MGGAGGSGAGARRVDVPQRRRQAEGSVDGARRGAGGPPSPEVAEHDSLDQVDCDRKGGHGCGAHLDDDLAVGHYKPINSKRFLHDCHEFVFHFTPEGDTPLQRHAIGVRYQDQSNVGRWQAAAAGVRCRGNTWFIPYETIQNRDRERPHPATFPSRLPEMCLRLHGLERIRTVADPFMGLGSTAVACAQLGLDFIGVELDESYLEVAVQRAKEAVAQESLFPTRPDHRLP